MLRHLFALAVCSSLLLCAVACDDGDDGGKKTADTSTADTTDTSGEDTLADLVDEDTTEADTAEDLAEDLAEDTTDDAEDQADTVDVWTAPAVFSLVYVDSNLREIVHMQGATSIQIPDVRIRTESLARQPIVGQTVSVSGRVPGTRVEPAQSVTDEMGLTPLLALSLGDDMSGASAAHRLTPFIVPNEPDHLRNELVVTTRGVSVTLTTPTDENGDPIPPVADGTSTWTVTLDLERVDTTNADPLPGDLSVAIELITNQGDPALRFADDTTATKLVLPVDPNDPSVAIDLISATTTPRQARFFVQLYQRDGLRGQRLELVDVVAP